MSTKHTPGPWFVGETLSTRGACIVGDGDSVVCEFDGRHGETVEADARLIAAAPTQHEEMVRYLPILERAESDPELWARLTAGTGIATLNGYRDAIAKATGEQA